MELLWEQDSLTARQIRENLYPGADKAQHGTVQRLLQRLEEKGYVERDRSHVVHFFSSTHGRHDYACGQLETLADKLTGGSITPLITHMVEAKRLSSNEIGELRKILEESEESASQEKTSSGTGCAKKGLEK